SSGSPEASPASPGGSKNASGSPAGVKEFDVKLEIVDTPKPFKISEKNEVKIKVTNTGKSPLPGGKDVENDTTTVGCWFSQEAKPADSFSDQMFLPQSLPSGQSTELVLKVTPKEALASGFITVRAFKSHKTDGQWSGAWVGG